MKRHSVSRRWMLAAGLCLLLMATLSASLVWGAAPMSASTAQVRGDDSGDSVEREVREVWTCARDIGIYTFVTDLSQATYPARTLAGTGGSPRRAALHIEGEINQPDRTLELRLWQPDATRSEGVEGAATPRDGAEMRIEGDRAVRAPGRGSRRVARGPGLQLQLRARQ